MQSAVTCSSTYACQIPHAFDASVYVATQLSLLGLYLTGDVSNNYPFISSEPGIGALIYLECEGQKSNPLNINNSGEKASICEKTTSAGGYTGAPGFGSAIERVFLRRTRTGQTSVPHHNGPLPSHRAGPAEQPPPLPRS